ncbi:hypothetical protein SAMN05421772_102188 [Paracoccus saliphilus]|uniref:Uncharacterized protein n=1 Tax=Paracoccus saliphilus TaxID=405559 RepID=A0AA45W228_9RHOB|nr:hypothetical protein SAMN05421772_102188 [Paracoccus saliphilus]
MMMLRYPAMAEAGSGLCPVAVPATPRDIWMKKKRYRVGMA